MCTLPDGRQESFEPGAFGNVSETRLNLQHDGAVALGRAVLADSPVELRASGIVPEGVHKLVRRGALRGLSVEFRAVSERREGNLRIVERASMLGLAIVDDGAYPASRVEARARQAWALGRVRARRDATCRCLPADSACTKVRFEEGAFDRVIDRAGRGEVDIPAIASNQAPESMIASTGAGTLRLSRGDDGGLIAALLGASRNTPAAKAIRETKDAAPTAVRPIIDDDASFFEDVGGVRTYREAALTNVLFKWAPVTYGWELLEILLAGDPDPEEPEDDNDDARPPRRLPRWL